MSVEPAERWRIGVLARRVGVTETLLRAWETRYGLLQPSRTASGYRLYGPEDEHRVRAMMAARGRGVPAAQAAAEVLAHDRSTRGLGSADDGTPPVAHLAGTDPAAVVAGTAVEALLSAMVGYDAATMHSVLDDVLQRMSVESAIRDVVLPFLLRVGDGWQAGSVDVADEHFASDLVRARLAALSIGAGASSGPLALLACAPDELHDIALKAFDVVLQRAGWRTCYLGARTPLASARVAADIVAPDVVVLAGSVPASFSSLRAGLTELGRAHRLVLAGGGSTADLAAAVGATHLPGDPVTAAGDLARSLADGS